MSPSKKKKRPSAGDDLINSIFDELSSKGSSSPKARTKSGGSATTDQQPQIPDISDKLKAAERDQLAEDMSLVLAVPGKHDVADPFDEFKKKRAAKAKRPNDVDLVTGSIPVLDLESVKSSADEDEAVDLSSPQVDERELRAEQTGSSWKSDFGAVSAPEDFAPAYKPNSQLYVVPEEPEPEQEQEQEQAPEQNQISAESISAIETGSSQDESPSSSEDEERTMRLVVSKQEAPQPTFEPPVEESKATNSPSFNRSDATEIRPGIKVPPAPKLSSNSGSQNAFTSAEAQLKQSESLRIAQNRISELERELERLRRDNEALSTAGDTLRRRGDELLSKTEALEIKAREATTLLEEERKITRGQLQAKDRDNAEMRARVEEIETRLESNFKKIRVRERELEHRLEIVKMESATLVSTKDKMILDLKRQIDQLTHEHDYAKTKTQELFNQYKDKQETQRRVVRALRIALTILEGDDETVVPLRKAE